MKRAAPGLQAPRENSIPFGLILVFLKFFNSFCGSFNQGKAFRCLEAKQAPGTFFEVSGSKINNMDANNLLKTYKHITK